MGFAALMVVVYCGIELVSRALFGVSTAALTELVALKFLGLVESTWKKVQAHLAFKGAETVPDKLPLNGDNGDYTWNDWARDAKKDFPVRFFLQEELPHFWRPIVRLFGHCCYWIRANTYNRYHWVDARTPEYRWGWQDTDYRMLAACFNLFFECVEKEHLLTYWAWTDDEKRTEIRYEIDRLYHWWSEERWDDLKNLEAMHRDHKDGFDLGNTMSTWERQKELEELDQLMFHRLVNVRQYLWT